MSLAAQSVIGSILIDAACLPVVRPLVTAQDFPLAADRAIFEAACRLADTRKPADVLTIIDDARRHGSDVSDQYAAELLQVTPTAAHAAEYGNILKQSRRMRQFSLSRAVKSFTRSRTPLPTCGSTEPTRQTGGALSYIRTQ